MALVTVQLIEGLERGRVYHDIPTPITIGREDDNSIRLNDERVSRFHAKIQEDGGRLILTDLESTNGTRVNGHPVQIRVLRVGDQVAIGRCILIIGSRDEIMTRVSQLVDDGDSLSESSDRTIAAPEGLLRKAGDASSGNASGGTPLVDQPSELFPDGPPEPPLELTPIQRAHFSDFIAYCHEQIRMVLQSAVEDRTNEHGDANAMHVDWEVWQRLLQTEMDLASYLRRIADPDH